LEYQKVHPHVFTCTAGDVTEFPTTHGVQQDMEKREQAAYTLRALGLLKYDAVGLGEQDLAYGVEYLKDAAEKNHLRFVCTNAVDDRTGEPLFDPWIVAEKAGMKVAFLAVVSPARNVIAQVESELLDKKVRLLDPTETVRKYLPELRTKADLVVLLAHTGIETAQFLADDLGVDVVVVGHYPAILPEPEKHGKTLLVMAGSKSDRFGTLDLTLGPDGSITSAKGDTIALTIQGPSVAEIQALFDEMDAKQKEARRQAQLAAQRAREEEQQQKAALAVHERGGILGAESCRTCHQVEYDAWLQTPHATAFATLAEADAWDDPECIGCHVTGVADKHHVGDVNIAPEVWNVQCEECHGSGYMHARDGTYLTTGESTCKRCHDTANSPQFDYELYRSYGVH
jgi:hypothetical protein